MLKRKKEQERLVAFIKMDMSEFICKSFAGACTHAVFMKLLISKDLLSVISFKIQEFNEEFKKIR